MAGCVICKCIGLDQASGGAHSRAPNSTVKVSQIGALISKIEEVGQL